MSSAARRGASLLFDLPLRPAYGRRMAQVTAPRILLLGEPALHARAMKVMDFASDEVQVDPTATTR